jgi:hypothetical protein
LFDGFDQRGFALIKHVAGAFHAALADVQDLGSFGL